MKKTTRIPQDKKKKGEIGVRTYLSRYIKVSYAKRVAAETETDTTMVEEQKQYFEHIPVLVTF